jgi:ubiquinone/menaquinone biosynthesis C-methylase UbiE
MASKQWQLAQDAAQKYEDVLVQAILGPFAKALVDWAKLEPNDTVVDVGCGTGAATRYAAERLGSGGKVIGTDVNAAMLSVAKSIASDGASIEWTETNAMSLSLDDDMADAVLCAQSLQFMPDRPKTLSEMRRILRPGATVYISLWCPIEQSPYFNALVSTIAEYVSPDTAAGLGAAFGFSQIEAIRSAVTAAGFENVIDQVSEIYLNLPEVTDFVPRHIRATPMGAGYDAASTETQEAIVQQMADRLSAYVDANGMTVPFRSLLISGAKPG